MNILNLLNKESASYRRNILIMTSLAGLSSTAMLAIINYAARTASYSSLNVRYFVMFMIAIALYVICLRYTFDRTTKGFENIIEEIRIRVAEKIRRTDLNVLDNIGKAEIYNRLTQDTTTISQFKSLLTAALQSGVIVIFVSLYMAFLSWYAFATTALLLTVGIAIYLRAEKACRHYIELSTQKEIEFFNTVIHIIEGFQEIKVNQLKSDDLFQETKHIAETVKNFKIIAERMYNDNYILTQGIVYFTMASTVFILPRLISTDTAVITATTTIILFIIGPLSTVVSAIPNLSKANIAIEHIFDLERRLDVYQSRAGSSSVSRPATMDAFISITLTDIEFTYVDKDNNRVFTVGPLSLTVHPNETLFIIGGNGSGKSTLLKLLTGLYYSQRGTLTVNDRLVNRNTAQSYRELFCIIFSDFHLFDKLYGLRDVQQDTVKDLLRRMDLSTKTNFVDGKFTTLDLSTGQRKRLALLVTLLEDRPIYVFDEWAAEQDPEFRAYFYEVVLRELHERGKTIISVTHDDRYLHLADRIIKMDYGKIEFIKTPAEL